MDISYERNVTTILTTIISNLITMVLLGVSDDVKRASEIDMDKALIKKGIAAPTRRTYFEAIILLIYLPKFVVDRAFDALVNLIEGTSKGMPYKHIRLLSNAEYFIGYDSQEEFDQDNDSNGSLMTTQQGEDNNDPIIVCDYWYKTESVTTKLLPKIWIPKYWPKKIMKGSFRVHAPPDEAYISNLAFDGMYSMKSTMSCLFGAVQCVSTIVISCMRLQNIDAVHTMDVLSMYTSYMLLCVIIREAFDPAYHCKPVVCIPRKELKKYQRNSSGLSYPTLRFRIHRYFRNPHSWGCRLIPIFLWIPICLMIPLLIYINKNDTLLLSLHTVWLVVNLFELYFANFSERSIVLRVYIQTPSILVYFITTFTGGLLTALIVCSCLSATTEQKYPSTVNWLPHF
jgi:hypothetical protein